jgi:hypothetical protein
MWPSNFLPQIPFFSSSSFLSSTAADTYNYLKMYFPVSTKDILSATLTTNLFVSSYIGTITTLQLSQYTNGSYSLKSLSVNNVTTDNPSWLMKDPYNGVLYCANEYLPNTVTNGSISAFKIGDGGVLTLLEKQKTVNGPVNTVLFNEGKNMAAAH